MNTQPTSGSLPRDRWAPVLAWSLCALSVAFSVPSLILLALSWVAPMAGSYAPVVNPVNTVLGTLTFLTFPTVGALIASRRPENPIGWIFSALGLGAVIAGFAGQYAIYSLFARPGSFPGGDVLAWLENGAYIPMLGLIGFMFLLFPTGRLPSRRWRPFAWFGVIGTVLFWAATAINPGRLADFPSVTNPFGVGEAVSPLFNTLGIIGVLLFGVFFLASAASLLLRFRHAKGEERQQLKWFASTAVVVVVGLVVWSPGTAILFNLGIMGLAVAVGIAILKYRLYDIDILIRRTITYAIVAALLVVIYFGIVIVLQQLFATVSGQRSEVITVLSTLAIAALFVPVRSRVQSLIDRRFNRRKYDAQKVLNAFSARMRDETNLEELTGQLVNVVTETMQPRQVGVWIKATDDG